MSTMQVTPGSGQAVNLPPPDGRAAAAASRPVTLCTEDQTALAAVATSAKQDTSNTLLTAVRDAIVAGNYVIAAVGSFARPADVTAYAAGQIIAQNKVTPSSCAPISLAVARANDKTGSIRRASLKINDSAWLNATVRVHLFQDAPTYAVGDGGAFTGNLTESGYLGYCDVTLDRSFSASTVKGHGVPAVGAEINFTPSAGTQNIFAVLEARSAVTPGSAKTFTVTVEAMQN